MTENAAAIHRYEWFCLLFHTIYIIYYTDILYLLLRPISILWPDHESIIFVSGSISIRRAHWQPEPRTASGLLNLLYHGTSCLSEYSSTR